MGAKKRAGALPNRIEGVSTDPSGLPPDLPPDLLGKIPLFAELQKVLSWTGGPVNWDLARQIAVASAAANQTSHQIDPQVARELSDDARVAELWIAEATGIEATPPAVRAVTPADWAAHACGAYRELIDPLAAKVSTAIAGQAPAALAGAMPPGTDADALGAAIGQMGPLLLGVQTGGIIGSVATDLLGGNDLPLPSDDAATVRIVLPPVDALAASYGLDVRQVRLWVVLHEFAHHAITEALPAVRSAFFAAYLDYVASLNVDFSAAFEQMQSIDFADPTSAQQQLGTQGFLDMLDSPESGPAAGRLDHLIALIESTADRMVTAATHTRLPAAATITEVVARHKASADGPNALARFIGITGGDDARRAADAFTGEILTCAGWKGMAKIWEDTHTVPSREDLSRPNEWLERNTQ